MRHARTTSTGDAATVFEFEGLAEAIGAAVAKAIADASTPVTTPEPMTDDGASEPSPSITGGCIAFAGSR